MRLAYLWTNMTGYTNACLRHFASRQGTEILAVSMSDMPLAPVDERQFAWLAHHYPYGTEPDPETVWAQVSRFNPDILLYCSWNRPAFRLVARRLAHRVPRIMAMDNQWLGTPKQYLGRLLRSYYIAPFADFAFVPGTRQATFARHLGFPQERIIYGLNTADVSAFEIPEQCQPMDRFISVGTLAPWKGSRQLLEAYRLYRQWAGDRPWPLRLCGTGPLENIFDWEPGVELAGFVQPDQLPPHFWRSGCAIQPSLFEPWAVSIHEATVAGLPVICTTACGASDHLVQDGLSGFLVPPGDVVALAEAMKRFTALPPERRRAMGRQSQLLSRQFSPDRWVDALFDAKERFAEIRRVQR